MTLKLQALIVGESSQLTMATAGLFSRSGLSVDVASTKHCNVLTEDIAFSPDKDSLVIVSY